MPTALVTGGAVRLGRSIALHLAGRGYGIALHYGRSKESAERTAKEVRKFGVQCKIYCADFADFSLTSLLMDQVLADFKSIDLLVNSAANFIQKELEETSNSELLDTININLMAPFILMREFKKKIDSGLIINILDQRILKRISTFGAYSVSKSALAHLTELSAVSWGETVRVNGIAPGLILPPSGNSDEYLISHRENIPTKTHGNTSDVLRGLDYLLDSPFVNGEIIFIDGGESKKR
ncbi:MAG: SDR family NAD(P)-dependent oxidoreductase [Nitrospina sp.]|jgi:pteridine reductase|nr:SDR family NAD(P)-dependent oxidoreductase [Nitrospina sp.]MBT6601009.1 SDR family NAD(P)-dependent oxidoreductase [Nitrospina sp.]